LPDCCARAESGHAASRLPTSDINLAPSHSITSSALACSVSGTVRPSALAVLRLITSSNLVRLLHRQISRLGTLQYLVHERGCLAENKSETWVFHFIPREIRDAIYDLVARNRYRLFGRRDACILAEFGSFVGHREPRETAAGWRLALVGRGQ